MGYMDINASVHTRNSFVAAAVALYEWALKICSHGASKSTFLMQCIVTTVAAIYVCERCKEFVLHELISSKIRPRSHGATPMAMIFESQSKTHSL